MSRDYCIRMWYKIDILFRYFFLTYLHDIDERGEYGAPEHIVVQRGVPQRGQVLQQLGAERSDGHAHALNQETEDVQN